MTLATAEEIYEQMVKSLPIRERLRLVGKIVGDLVEAPADPEPLQRRRWREIRGAVPYPLCGEDAQQWVSRNRQDADEQRERQWRRAL